MRTNPASAPVWATLARILSEQGNQPEAITAARKSVALAPKFAAFQADLGDYYLRAGKRGGAVSAAQAALALDPRSDVALTTLASCRLAEGNNAEAARLLERLQVVRGGKDHPVTLNLVAAYLRTGDKGAALRALKSYATKVPGDADAVLDVVDMAVPMGDVATATIYINRMEKLAPASPLPALYRGRLALGDVKKLPTRFHTAEKFFQKAVDKAPTVSLLRTQLAFSQLAQLPTGMGTNSLSSLLSESARTNFVAALINDNHNSEARRGLALLSERERFWEDAATQYQAHLRITPEDNTSRRRYAGVLLTMGRKDEAYSQFYELITHLPKDTQYLKELAVFFMLDKSFARARGAYEQVLVITPDDADALLGIAQCFVGENNPKEARDAYAKVILVSPKEETPYLLLAQSYADAGQANEATSMLEKMLVALPNSNAGRWQLIEQHISAKRDTDALREIGKLTLVKGDPNRMRYRMATGNLYLIRGRWADAAREFEAFMTEDPENGLVLIALADSYAKLSRKADADATYERAASAAEKALTRSPGSSDLRDVLVRARAAQNRKNAATAFLNGIDGTLKNGGR